MNQAMQVFLGSMFGDGNLFPNKGKLVNYSEMHSLKQKDYVLWKMKLMSKKFNFAGSPYIFNKYDKRTKKEYPTIKINSSESKKLDKYYRIFYKNGVKIVPKEFLYKLNKLGLAVWYQDDGTYHYGSYTCSIASNKFNYREHLLIKKFLKNNYNLECTITKKDDGFSIFFIRKNANKFLKIIEPFIHRSMLYKLGHLKELNKGRIVIAKNLISKNKKAYYLIHKEKIINYQKRYRKKNKEKISIRNKLYRINHIDKIREQRRKYYKLNRVRVLKRNRSFWHKNKTVINERKRLKRLKNG